MSLSGEGRVGVRWAATHGEQYHAKVLRVVGEGPDVLCLGSANWTRRNLGDLNLEANLLFQDAAVMGQEFDAYFESLWTNADGYEESLPYADWAEEGWSLRWKTWLYRFQEWSGDSTF
jgi:phosphatidylserine/phosphatidylglycerophosphate/cardiolipin synthase-like enzyme